ncbi:hypothetical protein DY000_02032876 [Brassica cretica]|uniref:Uncharacterized protein n=1 Tax=Brassica cretica TaxID=69181 RepID=A0ABQ7DS21_BRACR|nr:hypothetical protein DY000_02032876 [Brassica cretica]
MDSSSNIPCGHGMLYALLKFKVNAALVLGHWVMDISAGWFWARGLDGWQSETTCGLRVATEPLV